jgi:hypothetical protein
MASPEDNSRKLVAYALRHIAEQIETSHLDGFKLEWMAGEEIMTTELRRLPGKPPIVLELVRTPSTKG